MEGVIEEGSEGLSGDGDAAILDLGIIAAASRVEHYEIARYTTAISLAEALGESEAVKMLNESLSEEQGAEESLAGLSARLISDCEESAGATVSGGGKASERMMAGKH